MPANSVLFALITYGLTAVIALAVAGIIWLICRVVRSRGARVSDEE
jgi:hypothetical protein